MIFRIPPLLCLFRTLPCKVVLCPFSDLDIYYYHYYFQVDSAYDGGDYEGARRNSRIAMWLNISSLLCGVGLFVFIVIYFATI